MLEVNGPATAKMILDSMLEDGKIEKADYDKLAKLMDRTVEYIKKLDNPSKVNWHDIK